MKQTIVYFVNHFFHKLRLHGKKQHLRLFCHRFIRVPHLYAVSLADRFHCLLCFCCSDNIFRFYNLVIQHSPDNGFCHTSKSYKTNLHFLLLLVFLFLVFYFLSFTSCPLLLALFKQLWLFNIFPSLFVANPCAYLY